MVGVPVAPEAVALPSSRDEPCPLNAARVGVTYRAGHSVVTLLDRVAAEDLLAGLPVREPSAQDAERLALAVVLGTQALGDRAKVPDTPMSGSRAGLKKWTDR